MTTIAFVNCRITKDKAYWVGQCQRFADLMNVKSVQFGKQDIRGGFSITLVDSRGCVPYQEFFPSKEAMLGYVQGYVAAKQPSFDYFGRYAA